ncbi:MAG: methyl-accepting chemotaxis sensory transducer with sensor [Marmoricola sp.]|nr:methyl-accepting chemotaxis sensory transducer with sensor [Marmoricola sp.]
MTELDTAAPGVNGTAPAGRSRKTARVGTDLTKLISVLDGLPTRVMLADRDFVITYANPATIEGLRPIADWIPVDPEELVGASLDIFHKDPSYQRHLLADASNFPRRALISVGPETLDLTVAALLDDGEYVGAMATWENVTAKLELEKQVARVTSMMENSPTNMMFADREFVITYMNPASLETLAGLEEHLPVKASEVVGSSLDIFHNTPAYQRGILVDDANLPRRANISVGPETLDLLVSAIRDDNGEYIGAMATWEVITDRLRGEREVAEATADTAAVNNVLSTLASATTVDEAVQSALDTVRRDFGWAYGSYWKIDDADNTLKYVLESGDAGEEFRQVTLAASFAEGVGLSGRAWKTRDLFFTQDIGEMTDCVRAPVAQKVGVKSGVCFPIMVAGEVIGTMDFFATETLHPSEQRLESLRNVGRLVSQAIARVLKEGADREAAADVAAVNNVLSSLTSATSVDQAVQLALDTVRKDFGWAYGSYWKIDEADNTLKYVQESGSAGEEFRQVTLTASFAEGVGLSGRAWKTRDLFFTQDIGEMTDCVRAPVAQKVGVKSGVCFPIVVGGDVVGTMDFFATETLRPSEQRLDALRNVGRLVSQAVERLDKETAARDAAAELANKVDLVLEVVRAAGQGDLTREIPVDGDDAIGQLAAGLGSLLETLRGSMTNIGTTADTLAVASEQLTILAQGMGDGATSTSDRAASASGASVQVSASIQTVATAAEEMTASIREIAKNATEAATVATGAVSVASSAQGTVASLGESSAEIGQVIKVITSIAQQTNLLALNATIEAARAGDAGKGFAVVANEVKELAKETARATEDIGQKIEAIQSDTQGAVAAIAEISEVIGRINDIQTTIASAVEEQTATTNEIARSVTEAAAGANGIAEDVTQVASAAEDTRQGAQNTLQSATDLAGMAAELKGLVGRFTV